MKLKDFKSNFFQIPEDDLQFYGTKDPYTYFNLINEKIEKTSFFSEPVLDGELLRTEPLEYRFISHAFPNNRMHDSWKTRIDVKIERDSTGSVFYIEPKAGVTLWVFAGVFLISIIVSITRLEFAIFYSRGFLFTIILLAALYIIERFNIRRLIDRFKKEML